MCVCLCVCVRLRWSVSVSVFVRVFACFFCVCLCVCVHVCGRVLFSCLYVMRGICETRVDWPGGRLCACPSAPRLRLRKAIGSGRGIGLKDSFGGRLGEAPKKILCFSSSFLGAISVGSIFRPHPPELVSSGSLVNGRAQPRV